MRVPRSAKFLAGAAAAGLAATLCASPAHAQAAPEEPATFRRLIPGLDSAVLARFNYGKGFFDHRWKATGHADRTVTGLGPLYNAASCAACHVRDGRGRPPGPNAEAATGFVLKLGMPESAAEGRWFVAPDPVYGWQLQDRAIAGNAPEGRVAVEYAEIPVAMAGGVSAKLRRPRYSVADLAYGPLSPGTGLDMRVAPPVFGLGYIAAIDEADILAHADEADTDGDGISGKANFVPDADTGRPVLGRFGWKASITDIRAQGERAAALDMGLGSARSTNAGDCTSAQAACLALTGAAGNAEFGDNVSKLVAFYIRHLAVPERRNAADASVREGEALFAGIGCTACHTPEFTTSPAAVPAHFAAQDIRPYSDFLLHDMGSGLAGGLPAVSAAPAEWRTPPLWGIGLTEAVSGHTFFLHDGRARDLTEAILWHGGEAESANRRFQALSPEERDALLAFLRSL